ncbi:MAG: type 1 glutamine amidotransferase [Silicimonas sp.]|nr:type 1 glutamine amidotransferase [Silicimonas sp.]
MRIGILQCGHFPTADGFRDRTYSELYSGFLDGNGLTFDTWSVVDMEFPDKVTDAEGWLITGSRYGAYDDLPFIPKLESFIREAYDADVPLVGICFGHQIIAQALGGKVEKFLGGWSTGRVEYEFQGDSLPLNAWHQDQVVEKPSEAEVVGATEFCQYAALAYKGRAISLQPHPEFDDDEMRLLLEARAPGVVPDDMIAAALADVGKPVANARIAQWVADFFKESTDG